MNLIYVDKTFECTFNYIFVNEHEPFAIILFLFFFKFLISPGVMTESLRFRDVFLSWVWGSARVLPRVFGGLVGVDSKASIFPKSMV